MFPLEELTAYLAVALVLVAVPGPNTALIVAHSLAGGRRAGLATVAGVELGTLVHTAAAALGLSAMLTRSALAFGLVKWFGAAVLIVLGVRELMSRQGAPKPATRLESASLEPGRAMARAFVGNVLNPKVAIFFLAFLPQWVDPARGSAMVQFIVLGAILSALGSMCGVLLALAAAVAARHLGRHGTAFRWQRRLTGAVLIALGLRLAWQEAG